MSKLTGGLFSRPSGSNSGLTFGAGRTARAKRVTAREYVIPSQPLTQAQQDTRQRMKAASLLYRQLPEQIRLVDLKNLPGVASGYNAFTHIFASTLVIPSAAILEPVVYTLGALQSPDSMEVFRNNAASEFTPRWSTEIRGNAAGDDTMSFFYIARGGAVQDYEEYQLISGVDVALRSDGGYDVATNWGTAAGMGFYYFRSSQTGELSTALRQQPNMMAP